MVSGTKWPTDRGLGTTELIDWLIDMHLLDQILFGRAMAGVPLIRTKSFFIHFFILEWRAILC
jgi:hypothetical protein